MPAELFKRIDLDKLYPPFRAVMLEVIARCNARGAVYFATHGFRTFAEQHELNRLHILGKGGRAAPGGFSAHNYGLAFDFCADSDRNPLNGLQPDWKDPAYDVLGEEAKKAGLAWGASFGDKPHVGLPGFERGSQLGPLLPVLQKGGLAAVWKLVDAEIASEPFRKANPRLTAELSALGY